MLDPDVPYTETQIESYHQGFASALRWVIQEIDLEPKEEDRLWKIIDRNSVDGS